MEADVRELFNVILNLFFSIVTMAKLGLILTSIPLSLIHATEEILHENPSDTLLHWLAIIFGVLGPFIIAFPIISVQLVYATSRSGDIRSDDAVGMCICDCAIIVIRHCCDYSSKIYIKVQDDLVLHLPMYPMEFAFAPGMLLDESVMDTDCRVYSEFRSSCC